MAIAGSRERPDHAKAPGPAARLAVRADGAGRRGDRAAHCAAATPAGRSRSTSVEVGGRQVAVHEEAVTGSPFGTLLRFAKTPHVDQPRVLLVAPLSGHFATLLRDTVRTMLPDHDVYITDWHNCRDVPLGEGALRYRRVRRAPDRLSPRDRSRRASGRGVPAGRPGARGDRGDGRGRRSVPADAVSR